MYTRLLTLPVLKLNPPNEWELSNKPEMVLFGCATSVSVVDGRPWKSKSRTKLPPQQFLISKIALLTDVNYYFSQGTSFIATGSKNVGAGNMQCIGFQISSEQ